MLSGTPGWATLTLAPPDGTGSRTGSGWSWGDSEQPTAPNATPSPTAMASSPRRRVCRPVRHRAKPRVCRGAGAAAFGGCGAWSAHGKLDDKARTPLWARLDRHLAPVGRHVTLHDRQAEA